MFEADMDLISLLPAHRIATMCGGELWGDAARAMRATITGVCTDSRKLREGDLFVALVGPNFDGHAFLQQVAEQKASLALVSTLPPPEILDALPCVVVSDTLVGLQALGSALFALAKESCPGLKAIALTGSNGKTTTKELLRALWSTRGRVHATSGNLNNHIGVPITLGHMPAVGAASIIEMGANQPGDIAQLIGFAPADVRIITSIGAAHLEGFGGLDGVRAGKGEIFQGATQRTLAIVPVGERGALIPEGYPGPVLTFGDEESEADVRYAILDAHAQGTRARFFWGERDPVELDVPLFGEHNISNLAAALASIWYVSAIEEEVELDPEPLDAALSTMVVPGGRFRQVEVGDWLFLDDAYNANPSSVIASFGAFMQWQATLEREGPRIVVLGEMREIGEGAKNFHADVARCIARGEELHAIVCVGPFADEMAAAAREERALRVFVAEGVEQAASILEGLGVAGVVFLKASRGQGLERVIDIIQDGCPE